MTAIRPNLLHVLCLSVVVCCASALQAGESFPGRAPDNALIKTQQKVDKLFEKGDYKRAMLIYREDLAPVGDKFAQYMVGYMHYSGRGVGEDPVAASAWYRLAAERGVDDYVRVRDALMSLLNDDQRARSDAIYAELRAEMGDVVLITRLINDDLSTLAVRRGGGLRFLDDSDRLSARQIATLKKDAATRIEQRIDYLVELVAGDASASDAERETLRLLEEDVRRKLDEYEASLK